MDNPWKRYSKINPQREKGHREISNEVYMALMKADLTGGEYKISLAVIEKTWGFCKPSDKISISQFTEMTGLSGRMVNKIIRRLKQKRIIYYEPSKTMGVNCGSPINEFIFNKHYDMWSAIRVNCSSGMNQKVNKGELTGILRVNCSSDTKESTTKETTKEKYSVHFLNFWTSYPRKIGKDAAWKAWSKRNGDRPPLDLLLSAIEKQKLSSQWSRDGGQFIPYPATWLNQGRWNDEIEKEDFIMSSYQKGFDVDKIKKERQNGNV